MTIRTVLLMNEDKAITYVKKRVNQKFCHLLGLFSLQLGVLFSPKKPGQIIIIKHNKIKTVINVVATID